MSTFYTPTAGVSPLQPVSALTLSGNMTLPSVNKYIFVTSTASQNIITLPSAQPAGSWVALFAVVNGFTVTGVVTALLATSTFIVNPSGVWIRM